MNVQTFEPSQETCLNQTGRSNTTCALLSFRLGNQLRNLAILKQPEAGELF